MIVEQQPDIVKVTTYDELADKMVTKTTYDNSAVLKANAEDRLSKPEGYGRFKGDLCHVGRIHMGDIERLRNMGYNLLSNDTDEVRRCLIYIQENEPLLLTVTGTPFSKKRSKWH